MTALPEALPDLSFESHRVAASDGVTLAVQVAGEGPAVLLANGIGVIRPGLDFLAAHLLPDHRVICWDYRGAGASRVNPRTADLSMERHAEDAEAILRHLSVKRAAVLGWSMGVPVGLELIRRAPSLVSAFGALFGAAGTPFRGAFPRPMAEAVHRMLDLLVWAPAPGQILLDLAVALPSTARAVLNLAQFVGEGAHRDCFERNVQSVANANRRAYFITLRALAAHDAHDLLPRVTCPALVVAGGQDPLTPVRSARRMVEAMPDAELVVLPDASHFGVIEHGPLLWNPVDALLARANNS